MAKDFTMSFVVDQSPKEVFNAVLNVRGWWQGFYSEDIKGKTDKLNDEFVFRAGEGAHHTTQKLIEVIPELQRSTRRPVRIRDRPLVL